MTEQKRPTERALTDAELLDLIEQGYETSHKYGRISRLPIGETGLQAMCRLSPEWVQIVERMCASQYRRCYADREGNDKALLPADLKRFRELGGDAA